MPPVCDGSGSSGADAQPAAPASTSRRADTRAEACVATRHRVSIHVNVGTPQGLEQSSKCALWRSGNLMLGDDSTRTVATTLHSAAVRRLPSRQGGRRRPMSPKRTRSGSRPTTDQGTRLQGAGARRYGKHRDVRGGQGQRHDRQWRGRRRGRGPVRRFKSSLCGGTR